VAGAIASSPAAKVGGTRSGAGDSVPPATGGTGSEGELEPTRSPAAGSPDADAADRTTRLSSTCWAPIPVATRTTAAPTRTATAGLRAVRELAAIVLIGVKAVEGVTDVVAGHPRVPAAPAHQWGQGRYEPDYNDYEQDEP